MIQKLRLTSFRNFKNKLFEFSPKITVIIGPNASGKTNILESLYALSTGKSFKARLEEEMITHDQELARVKGKLLSGDVLEIILTRGELSLGTSRVQPAPRKRLLVNAVSRRLLDFAGNFKVVLFGPWDLDLVTASPALRRRFLDAVLFQVDREYRRAALSYEKGLRQRNKLLYRIREDLSASGRKTSRSSLLFWDRLLIKNGNYLTDCREEFISFINQTPDFHGQDFSVLYDKSAISESRLEQYQVEEVAAATTLVGPHRDDFCLHLQKKRHSRELDRFGSRGEQRMSVLWLKLAELSFIEQKTSEKPTLLLDDIFSELDHKHREIVMNLAASQQTIITTADPAFIANLKTLAKINLNH